MKRHCRNFSHPINIILHFFSSFSSPTSASIVPASKYEQNSLSHIFFYSNVSFESVNITLSHFMLRCQAFGGMETCLNSNNLEMILKMSLEPTFDFPLFILLRTMWYGKYTKKTLIIDMWLDKVIKCKFLLECIRDVT